MSIGFITPDPLNNLTNLYERPIFITADRAPTTLDQQNPGTQWLYNGNIYETTGAGVWKISAGTQSLDTINNLAPSSGNITLAGTSNQITATSGGSTITMSLPSAVTAPGSLSTTTTLTGGTGVTATSGDITATNGNVAISTAGKTLSIKSGVNAKAGLATLTSGAVVVNNVPLTANSSVLVSNDGPSGTPGALRVTLNVAGSSMTIDSTSATDNSTVSYFIFERT